MDRQLLVTDSGGSEIRSQGTGGEIFEADSCHVFALAQTGVFLYPCKDAPDHSSIPKGRNAPSIVLLCRIRFIEAG